MGSSLTFCVFQQLKLLFLEKVTDKQILTFTYDVRVLSLRRPWFCVRACMRVCVVVGVGCGGCRGGDCTTAVDVAELAGGCETGSGVADQGRLFELLQ